MTDPTPAPDWRALYQELRDAYQRSEEDYSYLSPSMDILITRADAALATPPAATRETGLDMQPTEFRLVDIGDGKPVQVQVCPNCGIAPGNVDDCGRFGDPGCPYFGIAPPRELVQEWVSEIWHEGTPVLTSASDMHIASKAADWARAQATRKEGPLPQAGISDEEIDSLAIAAGMDAMECGNQEEDGIHMCWEGWDHQLYAFTRAVLARWGGAAIAPVPVSERLPGTHDTIHPTGECWWFHPAAGWNLDFEHYQDNYTHWAPHWALPVPAADKGEVAA